MHTHTHHVCVSLCLTRDGTFHVHKAMSLLHPSADQLMSLSVCLLVRGHVQIQMGDGETGSTHVLYLELTTLLVKDSS